MRKRNASVGALAFALALLFYSPCGTAQAAVAFSTCRPFPPHSYRCQMTPEPVVEALGAASADEAVTKLRLHHLRAASPSDCHDYTPSPSVPRDVRIWCVGGSIELNRGYVSYFAFRLGHWQVLEGEFWRVRPSARDRFLAFPEE